MFRLSLPSNNNLRIELGAANNLGEFRRIIGVIKNIYESFHEGREIWKESVEDNTQNLVLPPWLCQPYIRTCPEEHLKKVEKNTKVI